jgi:Sulfotransferase family
VTVTRGIVLGVPRSGTTFLMSALAGLSSAECVSGNLFPAGVAHLAAQELSDQVRDEIERSFRMALADYLTTSVYNARSAALRKWWVASRRVSTLRPAIAGRRVERMLIYKEPFLAFAPQLAYAALREARLVYIFRDGRDVADSLVRTYDVLTDQKLASLDSNEVHMGRRMGELYVPWWVNDADSEAFLHASPYLRALWMWREMVRRCEGFFERAEVLASGRVLRVRYEELMSDPVAQGRAIVEHLGQELTPRVRERLQGAHRRSVGIHGRREGAELAEGERLAGAELHALGYRLSASADAREGELSPQ